MTGLIGVEGFCKINESDAELCAAVRGLAVGEAVEVGGGAAPLVRVARLTDLFVCIAEV